jgi:glucosamine kinase
MIVIGIDGGGTKTRCGVYDETRTLLAEFETGTSKVSIVGLEKSAHRITHLMKETMERAGRSGERIAIATIGLSGVWLMEEGKILEDEIGNLVGEYGLSIERIRVVSDVATGLEGALQGESGIMLIAGTGAIAVGKTAEGNLVRCGGWGINFGDEGSGAWIGRQGLRAVCRALDGRSAMTKLVEEVGRIVPTFELTNPRTLVMAYVNKEFDDGAICPAVLDCAEEGDDVCMGIVQDAVRELMALVQSLCTQHYRGESARVVLLGGLNESPTMVHRLLVEQIEVLGCRIQPQMLSAVEGARNLGMKMIGVA